MILPPVTFLDSSSWITIFQPLSLPLCCALCKYTVYAVTGCISFFPSLVFQKGIGYISRLKGLRLLAWAIPMNNAFCSSEISCLHWEKRNSSIVSLLTWGCQVLTSICCSSLVMGKEEGNKIIAERWIWSASFFWDFWGIQLGLYLV